MTDQDENRHYNPELDPGHPANPAPHAARFLFWLSIIEIALPVAIVALLLFLGYPVAAAMVAVIGFVLFLATYSIFG